MRDMKRTTGGLVGYESVNVRVRRNDPSSNGVSAGRQHSSNGIFIVEVVESWYLTAAAYHSDGEV